MEGKEGSEGKGREAKDIERGRSSQYTLFRSILNRKKPDQHVLKLEKRKKIENIPEKKKRKKAAASAAPAQGWVAWLSDANPILGLNGEEAGDERTK